MEKLIKLLNEYNIELHGVDRTYKDGFDLGYEQEYMRDFRVAYLISKQFGFIKRLVDNDKIDKEKFNYCRDNFFDERYFGYGTHEYIIMMLAIQDEPIEFLISLLK